LLVFVTDLFLQSYYREIGFGLANFGISFGMMNGIDKLVLLGVFVSLVTWMVIDYLSFKTVKFPVYLIVLGGLGNLLARMIWGNVWDYLWFPYLPFWFNLSDVLISVGVLSYILGSNGDSSTV